MENKICLRILAQALTQSPEAGIRDDKFLPLRSDTYAHFGIGQPPAV